MKGRGMELSVLLFCLVTMALLVFPYIRDCDDVCGELGMVEVDRDHGCAVACLCRAEAKPVVVEPDAPAPPLVLVPGREEEACTAACREVVPASFGSIGMKNDWSYVNQVGPRFGPPDAPSRCYCWEGPPHPTTDEDRAEADRLIGKADKLWEKYMQEQRGAIDGE